MHGPVWHTVEPEVVQQGIVADVSLSMSSLATLDTDRSALEEAATDLYEWLSLLRLQSPRTAANDAIDAYLSRYRPPANAQGELEVCRLSWKGLTGADWLRNLVAEVMAACPAQYWFSISATSFARDVAGGKNSDLTLLRPMGKAGQFVMWETSSPG